MATVTFGASAWTTIAGDKLVAGMTVAVGDLLVAVVGTSGIAGGTTNVTDGNTGGTYTEVFGTDWTSGANTDRLNIWVRNALIPNTTATTVTATQASSSGGGLIVYRVNGIILLGASAVASSGGQSSGTSSTTPAPVLSKTPLLGHPIIAAVINAGNPAGLTPRSGYTENASADLGYTVPQVGLESCFLASGETSATLTYGGTSATAFGSAAIELNLTDPAALNSIRMAQHTAP